jgi:dTMP kinase
MRYRAIDRTGQLVVFEGLDGVGKSTLSRTLLRSLRQEGIPCEGASFPGQEPGTLSSHIYRLYHNPQRFGINAVNHDAIQLLLTAAHIEVIESRVLPALGRGRIVVLDRFWWSTWVYGRASGVSRPALKHLLALEQLAWAGVVPTTVFLVTRSDTGENAPGRIPRLRTRLATLYRSLARREASLGRYPVSILANDDSIEKAVRVLRSRLHQRGMLLSPGTSMGLLRRTKAKRDR